MPRQRQGPDPTPDNRAPRSPLPSDTLGDLAARAAAGDHPAFRGIHDRLDPGLRRLFQNRARGRIDLADDLTQRTWAAVWRSFTSGGYDPAKAAVSTYVYAIAHHVWLQHTRYAAVRLNGAPPVPSVTPTDTGGAAAVELAERLQVVRAAMSGEPVNPAERGLDPDERAILRAVAAGESDRALASRLGLSPSTVNARKRAALDKLRRFLAARGFRADSAERPGFEGEQP